MVTLNSKIPQGPLSEKWTKYKADQNLSLAQGQLVSLEERLAGEKAILSGYIKAGDKANQQAQQAIVKDYENQVNTKKNEIKTVEIVFNNCYKIGDFAICGSRGWFFDKPEADKKIILRYFERT